MQSINDDTHKLYLSDKSQNNILCVGILFN